MAKKEIKHVVRLITTIDEEAVPEHSMLLYVPDTALPDLLTRATIGALREAGLIEIINKDGTYAISRLDDDQTQEQS